jgi:hypothetical protein
MILGLAAFPVEDEEAFQKTYELVSQAGPSIAAYQKWCNQPRHHSRLADRTPGRGLLRYAE